MPAISVSMVTLTSRTLTIGIYPTRRKVVSLPASFIPMTPTGRFLSPLPACLMIWTRGHVGSAPWVWLPVISMILVHGARVMLIPMGELPMVSVRPIGMVPGTPVMVIPMVLLIGSVISIGVVHRTRTVVVPMVELIMGPVMSIGMLHRTWTMVIPLVKLLLGPLMSKVLAHGGHLRALELVI